MGIAAGGEGPAVGSPGTKASLSGGIGHGNEVAATRKEARREMENGERKLGIGL